MKTDGVIDAYDALRRVLVIRYAGGGFRARVPAAKWIPVRGAPMFPKVGAQVNVVINKDCEIVEVSPKG